MNNLSYLFGWQLAGYFTSQDESYPVCGNIHSMGHGKWSAMGLNPLFIQGQFKRIGAMLSTDIDANVAPICNSSHSSPNPKAMVPNTITYATQLFQTQVLSSFNSTEKFAYVCNHLGYKMIASFPLDDQSLVSAVCTAANVQTPPQAEATLPWANPAAVSAARNTASIMFANMLAAAANSGSQLNIACAHAASHIANLDKERLNGDLVQSTLCQITQPMSTSEGRHMLKSWTMRYFITVLESISDVDGWLDWLCNNLDPLKVDLTGMDGYSVQMQVCMDSKTEQS